jgi:BirA family transcriptional regulator, biotin operon repressor / biotin---[acetyl-CoA-carboxylase] ligase
MLVAASVWAADGDWLLADHQTAGRGRLGREWVSPTGNVYASGLTRLHPGDPDAATLALVAALAVFDTLALWAPAIQLKWPNDVLAGDGAKLAGILLERAGNAVVIGVGVNLAHHPEIIGRATTSVAAMGTTPPEPAVFVETLAEICARWVATWRSGGLSSVRAAWLARAHTVGTPLMASLSDGTTAPGLFDGLTDDCALRLRLADGTVRVIHAGDIFLI